MLKLLRALSISAGAALFVSACAVNINEDILFASSSINDLVASSPEDITAQEIELAAQIASGELAEGSEEAADIQRSIALFGPGRAHEGQIGLFSGYLLDAPVAGFDLTISANGEALEWHRTRDDFRATRFEHGTLQTGYGPLETILIEAADQKASPTTRPLFVHCYGNAANLYNNGVFTALALLPFGDVLQFEYPGFFGPDQEEIKRLRTAENFDVMIEALANDLNAQDITRPLIFWGHSLGGLVCAELAARVPATDGLVLETTGSDVNSIARAFIPRLASPFVRLKVDPALGKYSIPEALAGFNAPILVLGARKDKTLSVGLARALHEQLTQGSRNASYAEFPDANHLSVKTQDTFGETLERFIAGLPAPAS